MVFFLIIPFSYIHPFMYFCIDSRCLTRCCQEHDNCYGDVEAAKGGPCPQGTNIYTRGYTYDCRAPWSWWYTAEELTITCCKSCEFSLIYFASFFCCRCLFRIPIPVICHMYSYFTNDINSIKIISNQIRLYINIIPISFHS